MIRGSDGIEPVFSEVVDPFLIRIVSLYECYGTKYDFARFYTQYTGERAVSLLSLFEGRMSLYLTADSDLVEIGRFITFSGCTSVIYNADFPLDINSSEEIKGDVLVYQNRSKAIAKNLIEPDISSVYEVLKSCEAEDFVIPDYLPFVSDMTHRKNKGKCAALGVVKDDILVSCAIAVSETENAVIIGAVATRPGYRRKGFSRQIVISLSEKYATQDKRVFLFSANENNTRFYQNSGYQKIYRFTEKQIG